MFSNYLLFGLLRTVGMAAVAATLALPLAQQAGAAGVSGQGTWEATLQGRELDGDTANGFEAYYDTVLDVTWLVDANHAFGAASWNGQMSWHAASDWARNLDVNGVKGWRLPTMTDTGAPGCDLGYSATDCGYNVSTATSEMAHLYYVTLGNKGLADTSGNYPPDLGVSNTGPFENIQPFGYWLSAEYAVDTYDAWTFYFYNPGGFQHHSNKAIDSYAWAVRSGDVPAVPEPETCALMLVGWLTTFVARGQRLR